MNNLRSTPSTFSTLVALLLLALLGSFSAPLLAKPQLGSPQAGLGVQQLNVGGVTLVQTASELSRQLGRPLAVHSTVDEATGERAALHLYPGLSVYLVEGEAMRVKVTDPAHPTAAGAKVGDRIDSVLELYQPSQPTHRGKTVDFRIEGSAAYLVFHSQRGRVEAIELRLDYHH